MKFQQKYGKFKLQLSLFLQRILVQFAQFSFKKFRRSLIDWQIPAQNLKIRLFLFSCLFALLYFILAIRLFYLTTHEVDVEYEFGYNQNDLESRKELIDRNGALIATNLISQSIYANPKKILNADQAAKKLSKIFKDLTYKEIKERLLRQTNFIWLKRNITPKEQLAVNNLGLPGIFFKKEYQRTYSFGKLFSHAIGFVDTDNKGLAGFEKFYNEQILNGSEPTIKTSLDVRAQTIAREELQKYISKFSALGGCVIVADVETGEIIALTSLPDFDPHNAGRYDDNSMFNRASLSNYEMGSIMKSLTIAIGLDTKATSLKDVYNLDRTIQVDRFVIKDYRGKKGWRTVPEIFMYSSNIGIAKIALEIGIENQKEYFKKLGLFDRVDIEIKEKAYPIYPRGKYWGNLSSMTIGYGHGISLSPLHMVQAAIPMVNGGIFRPLTLIKDAKQDQSKRIFSKKTSIDTNKLLRLVVKKGTGRKADVNGLLVGGKTGTANKAVNGKYQKNLRISSFLSAFPMHKPKFVVLTVLDEPKGTQETFNFATAGWNAAPLAGDIIKRLGPLYNIGPYDENSPEIADLLNVAYQRDENV